MRLVFAALATLLAGTAAAQPRPFSCLGAEQMEEDVFAVPFARGSAVLGEAARSPLAAAVETARRDPQRVICVLGHAGQEGGAVTSTRLAAERARAVAQALAEHGVDRERIRAEARNAQFSPRVRANEPPSRTVTVIVMPAAP